MSIYPPSYGQPPPPTYGHPGYSNSGYAYPAPAPPSVPQPVYHLDPVTFRRDYSSRLAELTINSRPIIQGLSMMAQDYTRYAEIVSQSIEAHIRRVSHLFPQ